MVKAKRPARGVWAMCVVALGLAGCDRGPARSATLAELRGDSVRVDQALTTFAYARGLDECLTFPGLQATLDGQPLAVHSLGARVLLAEDQRAPLVAKALYALDPTDCISPTFAGIGEPAEGLHTVKLFDGTATRELTFRVGSLSSVRVVSPSDGVLRQGDVATFEFEPAELKVSMNAMALEVGDTVLLDTSYDPATGRDVPEHWTPGTVRARVGWASSGGAYRQGDFPGTIELTAEPAVVGCTFGACSLSAGPRSTFQLEATFEGHAPDGGV